MATISFLLFWLAFSFAQSNYIVEDLDKEGQVQGYKLNYDSKFDVSGGTITGKSFFSSNASFTSTSSTVTFNGWVDIGFVQVSSAGSSQNLTATCPTGKTSISCGGYCGNGGQYILSLYNDTSTTCFISCQSAVAGNKVFANCARIKP